ncbi:putative transcriptional regulator, arsR family; arsR2 [Bradyrhizobium sp. ORS 285]|nr:putative transcriptional regulator, arsR family; arsR2 [Bradyrhizobium sp. ORS 285]
MTSVLYIDNSGYMESERAVLALAALAQATRLQAFRILVQHEPEGLPAGELARLLEVPQNTLSSHLSVLARAGLVSSIRHSRSIVYRADLMAFQEVALFLVRDCCGGRPEVCAPLIASLTPCCPPTRKEKSRA